MWASENRPAEEHCRAKIASKGGFLNWTYSTPKMRLSITNPTKSVPASVENYTLWEDVAGQKEDRLALPNRIVWRCRIGSVGAAKCSLRGRRGELSPCTFRGQALRDAIACSSAVWDEWKWHFAWQAWGIEHMQRSWTGSAQCKCLLKCCAG